MKEHGGALDLLLTPLPLNIPAAAAVAGLLLLAATLGVCQQPAQPMRITVHLINGKSGKPMARREVTYRPWGFYPVSLQQTATTDSHGIATFAIVPPSTQRAVVGDLFNDWSCSHGNFCVRDALEKGVLLPNYCKPKQPAWASQRFKPRPGDIYVFEIPFGPWAWVRQELFRVEPGPTWYQVPPPHFDCPENPPLAPIGRSAPDAQGAALKAPEAKRPRPRSAHDGQQR